MRFFNDYHKKIGPADLTSGYGLFYPRDVAAPDFTLADFITDATWKDNGLDLSAMLPDNTIAVLARIKVVAGSANKSLYLKKNAGASLENRIQATTTSGGSGRSIADPVGIDADKKLDYYASNTAWTNIDVYILGWWVGP